MIKPSKSQKRKSLNISRRFPKSSEFGFCCLFSLYEVEVEASQAQSRTENP